MNGVRVRDHENIEKAIKRFSRTMESSGILSEVKRRRRFEKPCIVERIRKNSAKRKMEIQKKIEAGLIKPKTKKR
jgi:small subunit ribosomal protein S21